MDNTYLEVPQRRHDHPAPPLTHVGRLQFLGRIFDQDLQMPDVFPNVICVVMVFDELNTVLDWRKAASKRYN